MTKTERIKVAIKVAFTTGILIGSIGGSAIGYNVGAGNIQLPEKEKSCYLIECVHYDREPDGTIVYEKEGCCGEHGHNCETYPSYY